MIPVELVQALKCAAIVLPIAFLLGGLGGPGTFWANASTHGLFAVAAVIGAIIAGAIVVPILLPWLPGRAFAMKGLIPGFVITIALLGWRMVDWGLPLGISETIAWLLFVPALTTYLAMNFTGASTYTSLSGVKKEMRWSVPLQIVGAVAGLGLWLASRFIS